MTLQEQEEERNHNILLMSDTIFTLPEADRSLEDIIETCCSQETVELKTCIQLVIAYILTFYDANSQIPIPVRNIYALM